MKGSGGGGGGGGACWAGSWSCCPEFGSRPGIKRLSLDQQWWSCEELSLLDCPCWRRDGLDGKWWWRQEDSDVLEEEVGCPCCCCWPPAGMNSLKRADDLLSVRQRMGVPAALLLMLPPAVCD